jgi:hypothetical protein
MKRTIIGVAAVAALGSATYLAMELLTTDRRRVERVVRGLARRIEARDAAGFCHLLAEDYRDEIVGNRAAIREYLTAALPFLESVRIELEGIEIAIRDTEAEATFTASGEASGRRRPDLPPWRHQSLVRLWLRKRGGEWRVTAAEYRLPPVARRGLLIE